MIVGGKGYNSPCYALLKRIVMINSVRNVAAEQNSNRLKLHIPGGGGTWFKGKALFLIYLKSVTQGERNIGERDIDDRYKKTTEGLLCGFLNADFHTTKSLTGEGFISRQGPESTCVFTVDTEIRFWHLNQYEPHENKQSRRRLIN